MKTFKQHTKAKKKEEGSGVIPAPIHFKQVESVEDMANGVIPAAIHFKHINDKKKNLKEAKKKGPDHFQQWMNDGRGNAHLAGSKTDPGPIHTEISKNLHSTNNFTDEHATHIKNYTNDISKGKPGSRALNTALLKGKVPKKHEAHAKGLDSAIDNNRIQHDVHVYSGTSFNPTHHMDENGRLHSPAYISATHSKPVAAGYAQSGGSGYGVRHIAHIHLRKGDPATHVSQLSNFKGEHETLIKRGVTLQHHGTDKYYDSNNENWYHIHHMTIAKD